MALSIDSVFGLHEQALQLRAQRSEVLARNLANADTPGYKARDFDFARALRQAAQGGGELALRASHPRHIVTGGGAGGPEMQYRVPMQPALDGNTVETDVEKAAFAENAMRYEASLMILNRKISGMSKLLQGGGN
jgi:flagellar basal-body rod protein FlgB